MNGALYCGVVFAVLLTNAAAGQAHSLASTIVSVTMTRPGTVQVTIAAEADPLIAKLEALAGAAESEPPATSGERRARLEALFPTLRANIDARVAGESLVLELQDVEVDDTAQTEIHLVATPPGGPQHLTWRCTFLFGAYQLASGDAAGDVQWLQGPQTSTPIALVPPHTAGESFAPALTRIGHSIAMGTLVVYVIRRRASTRSVRQLVVSGFSRTSTRSVRLQPDVNS
jgi:hypothetical protein